MATKKAALACSVCGSDDSKSVSEGKRGERLEINKFCNIVINTRYIKKRNRFRGGYQHEIFPQRC